jgi:ABC-2 type transport system permease protein
MFASFLGLNCAKQMRADLSPLGMRKSLAPTHRMKIIMGDIWGNYLIQCIATTLFICYMQFVLKIDYGDHFFYVLLTAYMGSLIGLMLGLFIGSLRGIPESARVGISITTSLLLSFFSGLMVGDIRWKIEAAAPILNRLNPATVIADALYSLNIYDTYTRFYTNIGILGAMSVVLCVVSYLMVRRQDYASL